MKILFISTISLLVAITSLAQSYQRIELESQEIARTLKAEARFLTQDQILKISKNLELIRNIINNTSDPSDYAEYTCVSRDNDGRSPYVAASVSLIDFSFKKGSEVFSDISSCKEFLNGGRR